MRRAVFALALLLPATVAARDFHVEPYLGSADGDGSSARPWRTLQDVVAAGLSATATATPRPGQDFC